MIKRILIALAAVIGLVVPTAIVAAPSAQAYALNNVICYDNKGLTNPTSPDYIKIWLWIDSTAPLWKGHCSSEYSSMTNNRAFLIPFNYCVSQWGYHYQSDKWYFWQTSNNVLRLQCG